MNRFIKFILIFLLVIAKTNNTDAYFFTNDVISNDISTNKYNIKLDATDGIFENFDLVINDSGIELPIPYREGYEFLFYTDENGNRYSNIIDNLTSINNKNLHANWNKNTYLGGT